MCVRDRRKSVLMYVCVCVRERERERKKEPNKEFIARGKKMTTITIKIFIKTMIIDL